MLDSSTLSNYTDWVTNHTTLDLNVNFLDSVVEGSVTLLLKKLQDNARDIILDSSYLDIEHVTLNGGDANFTLEPRSPKLGQPLRINVPATTTQEVKVTIRYKTTSECTALQWLTPAQTSGSKPFMFSQCQAIHARSMFPCQDTPAVKSQFKFNLRSPYPLVATGTFKGTDEFDDFSLMYHFEQPVPIPSYLAAIASGDIASFQIGPRSLLYIEPTKLQSAQFELRDIAEKFIKAAESFLPPYAWGTYNVLCLPQSFPYGGMENPQITFITPTLLSGDGANLNVIAHEIAHSWSGNLVTCNSWAHFWLNEGWTVFLERKVLARVYSREFAEFSAIIGWESLSRSIQTQGESHEFTKLIPDLKDQDPDDAFSSVPYEKGYHLLRHLESLVGEEAFENFAFSYFAEFAGKSIDSDQFVDTFQTYFEADESLLAKLDWNKWFYTPGLPPRPEFDSSLSSPCYDLALSWRKASLNPQFHPDSSLMKNWSAGQKMLFLDELMSNFGDMNKNLFNFLSSTYKFDESHNTEILYRYYMLGLKLKMEKISAIVSQFLGTVGRMKFVRPLFRALNQADPELARQTFERVSGGLHAICKQAVRKDLGL